MTARLQQTWLGIIHDKLRYAINFLRKNTSANHKGVCHLIYSFLKICVSGPFLVMQSNQNTMKRKFSSRFHFRISISCACVMTQIVIINQLHCLLEEKKFKATIKSANEVQLHLINILTSSQGLLYFSRLLIVYQGILCEKNWMICLTI